jgi:hypothetical protein
MVKFRGLPEWPIGIVWKIMVEKLAHRFESGILFGLNTNPDN